MGAPLLRAANLDFAYHDGFSLKDINLSLEKGDLVALIGPNGAGKTTLLKLLSHLLRPRRGQIKLAERDLESFSRRELARYLAVVPQGLVVPFSFTAWEMAMMGRTPYARPFFTNGAEDERVVREKMEMTNTLSLAQRLYGELSGGEQQRVIIAMALAQEPQILLIDEPIVHLDINHQIEILELIKRLNRDSTLTVLATMHDLNLAALYFDRLILLDEGCIVAEGSPDQVLIKETIEEVFRARVEIQSHPTRRVPHIILLPPGS